MYVFIQKYIYTVFTVCKGISVLATLLSFSMLLLSFGTSFCDINNKASKRAVIHAKLKTFINLQRSIKSSLKPVIMKKRKNSSFANQILHVAN